jgi:putative mRNA 3-end processing factor
VAVRSSPHGLSCPAGGFHVDPVSPVAVALITHAHADHAQPGSARYLCTPESVPLLRRRVGDAPEILPLACGETRRMGSVDVSLHPAGHVLGSAQVRIAGDQGVWVVSGDYKRQADPTCPPMQVLPCDVFVTESTFALPLYRWPPLDVVLDDMRTWIAGNMRAGRPSVVLAYALGKAQRLIALLAPHLDQPMLAHGAVAGVCDAYREAGVDLPLVEQVRDGHRGRAMAGRVVMAPPSALGTPWMKRFPQASTALVSGWMRVRGRRRWKGVDRGFVISDHADWHGILQTIAATGARRVLPMHGYADVLARHLREQGLDAVPLQVPAVPAPEAGA